MKFVKSEIVDRKPTPGEHRVSAGSVSINLTTSNPEVTIGRTYPKPPVGVSLNCSDDVLIMLGRYEDLWNGKEKLTQVASFCLTMLERLAESRPNASKRFGIARNVLDEVGKLTSKKGGPVLGRKATAIDQELTPGETKFLENSVSVFIRRVAEEAQSPGGPFRKITLEDFPELQRGTN